MRRPKRHGAVSIPGRELLVASRHLLICTAVALMLAAGPAAAQSTSGNRWPSNPGPAGAAAQKADPTLPAKPPMPDVTKLTLLVQTHMAALSHALMTGNFTVLYALGAPGFQKVNTPAQLAEKFAQFRAKGIDILPVVLFQPVLVNQPMLDEKGLLRLTGYYKTEPQQVHFDLLFQPVDGAWRLFGISASTQLAKEVAAADPPVAAAPKKAAAVQKK